jgi:hypothetical protein
MLDAYVSVRQSRSQKRLLINLRSKNVWYGLTRSGLYKAGAALYSIGGEWAFDPSVDSFHKVNVRKLILEGYELAQKGAQIESSC